MQYKVIENNKEKRVVSKDYNSFFSKEDGKFVRWGNTLEDDPSVAPSAEILDIEVSTICHAGEGKSRKCLACYKSNTSRGKNMSLDMFKKTLDKVKESGILQQLAFGIGSIDANLELFQMAAYAREVGVIPNITINGDRMTPQYYDSLVKYMGAVAVSRYDPEICYNAVYELTRRGLKQCNIHMLLSNDTYEECFKVIEDSKKDYRLKNLGAIVFLLLKPKGRGTRYNQLKDRDKYKKLINFAFEKEASIGFDSCGANEFMHAVKDHKYYKRFSELSESCESTAFSSYCNVNSKFFPCSFAENTPGWEEGLDIANCNNFVEDIWMHPKTIVFRKNLLKTQENNCHNCRECPIYELKME